MNPRRLVQPGLPGPGQTLFSEEAKEEARNIGFKKELIQIIRNTPEDDEGGDTVDKWAPVGKPWAGRIDALTRKGQGQVIGEQINEASTHVVTMDPEAQVLLSDRLEIEGRVWIITSEELHTDQATVRVQVREQQA